MPARMNYKYFTNVVTENYRGGGICYMDINVGMVGALWAIGGQDDCHVGGGYRHTSIYI